MVNGCIAAEDLANNMHSPHLTHFLVLIPDMHTNVKHVGVTSMADSYFYISNTEHMN